MANYLAGIGTTALLNVASPIAPVIASSPQSSSGVSSGLISALAFGAFNPGTKPKALHTEHASGEANWIKPYGDSTDIIFYLQRADIALEREQAAAEEDAEFGAASQTGPDIPTDVQSPLNQIASKSFLSNLTDDIGIFPGLTGPLTGLGPLGGIAVGAISQTASFIGNTTSNVRNIVGSAPIATTALVLSLPSSEEYFSDLLHDSFDPDYDDIDIDIDIEINTNRSAVQISRSFNAGANSSLATDLAIASGGVRTSAQLIEGINKGAIGFTTPSGGAEANRLGPEGYSRERLAK